MLHEALDVPTSTLDPRWDAAIELLLAGATKKAVAQHVGVHRNTVSNWLADARFQAELTRRMDDRLSALRIRRLNEISRFVDSLYRLATDVMTAAERTPSDRRAQRAARAWLRNYLKAREIESQVLG